MNTNEGQEPEPNLDAIFEKKASEFREKKMKFQKLLIVDSENNHLDDFLDYLEGTGFPLSGLQAKEYDLTNGLCDTDKDSYTLYPWSHFENDTKAIAYLSKVDGALNFYDGVLPEIEKRHSRWLMSQS